MLKICVIGAGIIAESHLKAIDSIDNATLTAIADIVPEKAGKLSEKYGGKVYSDYKEMLLEEKPDAAIITLPHKLHTESTVFCAERGIHVLLEKPMAVSTADCDIMIEAARKNNIKLMLGHVVHYVAENIKVKEIIESGQLGKLMMISDIRNSDYFVPTRPAWFLDRKMSGGGILINLGAHSIDKILWTTNSKIRKIAGKAGAYAGLDIEGNAQVFMELENGVTALLNCYGYKTPYVDETMYYFTEGTIKLSMVKGLWISRGQEYEEYKLQEGKRNPFVSQLEDFINCIINDLEPPISSEYGREIIEAIETVYGM